MNEKFDPSKLREKFNESFSDNVIGDSADYIRELTRDWNIGSDAELLDEDDRAELATQLELFKSHPSKPERIEDVSLNATLKEGEESRLGVSWDVASDDRACGLSAADKAFFDYYGVLPARETGISTERLDAIERTMDHLIYKIGINASLAWLLDRDILELALQPEIVGVSGSLLGDATMTATSGPFYLPPARLREYSTPWHGARGRALGGGGDGLDLVTCWVALCDATLENGCVKMVPRSFMYNEIMSRFDQGTDYVGSVDDLVPEIVTSPYEFCHQNVAQMITRRLNAKRKTGIRRPGVDRYPPINHWIDIAHCMGMTEMVRQGAKFDVDKIVALPARRGQFYAFTSDNAHASAVNHTKRTRKALSLRYVKTSAIPRGNSADDSASTLSTYLEKFPALSTVFRHLDINPERFSDVSPRIRITGTIPAGAEDYYIDAEKLRRILADIGPVILKTKK